MSGDLRTQIEAVNREFVTAFMRGDASAIARLYTSNAQLLPAHSDFVRGTDAIRAFWQGAFGMGLTGAALDTLEVETHGDTTIEVGHYTLRGPGGTVADSGKYIVIWKNEAGTWKLHRDIWTTTQPAAVASA